MRLIGWYPPDGAVALIAGPGIDCACCSEVEMARTPAMAVRLVQLHRCPPGTRGAVPACPVCASTTDQCMTLGLGGRHPEPLPVWHAARTQIAQAAIGGLS